jgi:hypothetical protein
MLSTLLESSAGKNKQNSVAYSFSWFTEEKNEGRFSCCCLPTRHALMYLCRLVNLKKNHIHTQTHVKKKIKKLQLFEKYE